MKGLYIFMAILIVLCLASGYYILEMQQGYTHQADLKVMYCEQVNKLSNFSNFLLDRLQDIDYNLVPSERLKIYEDCGN